MDAGARRIGRRPRPSYGCIRRLARRGPIGTAALRPGGPGPIITWMDALAGETRDRPIGAVLALDLGASRLRAAVVDGSGRVVTRAEARSPVEAGPQGVLATAIAMLRRVRGEAPGS